MSAIRLALRRVPRSRALAGLVVAALLVAACGSSVSPSPSGDASASAADIASSPADVSPSATPNLHAAPDLEALLPDTIGGTSVSKVSMSGPDFLSFGSDASKSELQALLGKLGRTIADLTVADTFDPTGTVTDQAAIFRVHGADPTRLLSLWVASQTAATHGSTTVTNPAIDGRTYTRVDDRSQSRPAVSYVLSSGDALYIVASSDVQIVSAAMAKMVPR